MGRAGVLLCLLLAAAPARADALAGIRRDLVAELEELTEWCTKSRLLRTRNGLYELILTFEPDHEKARYWLRYEREGDAWVRPKPYREPRDFNPDAEPEFEKLRAALVARLARRLEAFTEKPGPQRAPALALLLAVDPSNEWARTANGEVRWRNRWVLRETPRTFARRKEMQEITGRALRAVPKPVPDAPTEKERSLGLPWACAYQGHWWRFVATVRDKEEVRLSLHGADAAADMVAGAIPDETRPLTPEGMRAWNYVMIYLESHDQGRQFLARHPGFTAADRRFAASLGGAWVPKTTHTALWFETPAGRRDAACRDAIGVVMGHRYGHFKQGWIVEGFGVYLGYRLVGTRLTVYVTQTKYATEDERNRKIELWQRMQSRGADWLALVRRLGGKPDLRFLASKGLNEMTPEDLLWAHALAAYLIEGRPDELSEFLALSVDHDLDTALEQAYGMAVPELESRLLRWLDETG